jgi:UDP:flavonoid glycosyltransferase YjiC (YdhE family)
VLVTLGTVYDDDVDLIDMFAAALSDPAYNVVQTSAGGDYLPHSAVLPQCAAVVCHGGYSTVIGAMSKGVPAVCVPLASDQFYNAERCVDSGAGIMLDRDGLTSEAVHDAVAEVIADPAFAIGAGTVRDVIHHLAWPRAIVAVLEERAAQ